MESHAEMLGIDLDQLNRERFDSWDHFQLLREHLDRVRMHEIQSKYEAMVEQTRAREAEAEAKAKMIRKRKNEARRIRKAEGSKRSQGYEFTDKQMEIAIRSIGRHAETG